MLSPRRLRTTPPSFEGDSGHPGGLLEPSEAGEALSESRLLVGVQSLREGCARALLGLWPAAAAAPPRVDSGDFCSSSMHLQSVPVRHDSRHAPRSECN